MNKRVLLRACWYNRMIPSARLLEVPGAGHKLMLEHPDVVRQAISMVL